MGNPGGQTAVHIVDPETGQEVTPGEVGVIYFANATRFDYHKDPGKTAEFFNDKGWGTLGDMGWIDEEGYLYLTDRKSHMIISGGVNIYPQEIESVLALHPAVADVTGAPRLSPLKVVVNAPSWLDTEMIYYRLPARDGDQARVYANSRWLASPVRLFGDRLRAELPALGRRAGLDVQAIGDGPVVQVFFGPGPLRSYRDVLATDQHRRKQFGVELVKRGVLTNPGEKLYLSLAHTDDDLDRVLVAAGGAFQAVAGAP